MAAPLPHPKLPPMVANVSATSLEKLPSTAASMGVGPQSTHQARHAKDSTGLVRVPNIRGHSAQGQDTVRMCPELH